MSSQEPLKWEEMETWEKCFLGFFCLVTGLWIIVLPFMIIGWLIDKVRD